MVGKTYRLTEDMRDAANGLHIPMGARTALTLQAGVRRRAGARRRRLAVRLRGREGVAADPGNSGAELVPEVGASPARKPKPRAERPSCTTESQQKSAKPHSRKGGVMADRRSLSEGLDTIDEIDRDRAEDFLLFNKKPCNVAKPVSLRHQPSPTGRDLSRPRLLPPRPVATAASPASSPLIGESRVTAGRGAFASNLPPGLKRARLERRTARHRSPIRSKTS